MSAPHSPHFAPLTLGTAALLTIAPLLWAGNAVVGRLAADWIPPMSFNFLRWLLAFAILLPLAAWVLRRNSGLWQHWRRFALLGLLAIAGYNSLQYLALHTSTPINVTLVAASMPVWMLLIGRLFFSAAITRQALVGAALSLLGVLVVLTHGEVQRIVQLQLVPGDAWMLLAACVWALYSWLLTRRDEPVPIRADWSAFLLAQIIFGLFWSAALTAGEWWVWPGATGTATPTIAWSWGLVAVLVFVAVGPGVIAYRFWGEGVQRAGPTVASFFSNLTPLLAALMSAALLGEPPQAFHAVAFALIVAGIAVSSLRR